MVDDVLVSALGWSFLGAFFHLLAQVYGAYARGGFGRINWKRMCLDAGVSFVFGSFGVLILMDIGIVRSQGALFGPQAVAVIGGFVGFPILKKVCRQGGVEIPDIFPVSNSQYDPVVEFVHKYGSITNDQLQKLLKVSDRTATRRLSSLAAAHVLQRVNSNRGTKYILL